jgi:hypothetical protein
MAATPYILVMTLAALGGAPASGTPGETTAGTRTEEFASHELCEAARASLMRSVQLHGSSLDARCTAKQ